MQYTLFVVICSVTAFVLISDHQKIVLATPIAATAAERYTTKYDTIDIDRILQSRRLLLNYVNCMLDKGPCTVEGKELKKYVPDALETECSKCSAVQKQQAGKVFSHLLQNHRPLWDELVAKYDKTGNFRRQYQIDEDYDYSQLDQA